MNIENPVASALNGGGSTLRISGLTATDGYVLTVQADGTLATEAAAASGVGGSTGATDNALLRADGTGGATVQSSGITVADAASGVAEMTSARLVRGQRVISSSPDTQLGSDDTLYFSAALTVDLLTSITTGREFLYVCTSAATLTLDPGGTDTIDGGGAGVALAIPCATGQAVRLIRSGSGAWRSVQPGGLATYSAPTLHMYPSGTDMLVAIEVYSSGSWVAVKGPTAVSRTAGSSGNNASISGSAIASASGYATLSDQPLEGDSWREPLDGSGVLAATWTPGAAGWLRIEVTSDQPTVTYYQVYGYAGHPTPGTGPGLRAGWGRGASTKAVHVASDNNTDGGTSPAATATGPAIAYWEWDATATYTARGWGRVSGGVIEDNPATPPSTPTTMAIIAGVLRPVLGGGTLSATLDVRVYPAPGTLSWTP